MRATNPLTHLENATAQLSSQTLDKSEWLLIAHQAAIIYDAALAQLGPSTCYGTYWRNGLAFQEAARELEAVDDGRKRRRPPEREARQCNATAKLRRGPVDPETGQVHGICNACYKAYKRDVDSGLVVEQKT